MKGTRMSSQPKQTRARVLVTGAGGAAGIAVIRALAPAGHRIHAGDCDPLATGLHLVAPDHRALLPRGDDERFCDAVLEVCLAREVNVLIPTVDEELIALAHARGRFAEHGIVVLCPSEEALARCLDKHALVQAVRDVVACPRTELLDERFDSETWQLPMIVKPRTGRGGEGFQVISDAQSLALLPRDGTLIAQELLPGEEYSVDVLIDREGAVVAAVPRVRLRVDSGVAVVSRTLRDPELEHAAGRCARAAGIRGAANVQFRRDEHGTPRLLEINPRFPGTLAITIASGVNLPALALADALGATLPDDAGTFAPVGMVRMLGDMVVDAGELEIPAGARPSPDTTLALA